MKKKFEYEQTTKIIFGSGCIKELPGLAAGLGNKILLVTGKKSHPGKSYMTGLQKACETAALPFFILTKYRRIPLQNVWRRELLLPKKKAARL